MKTIIFLLLLLGFIVGMLFLILWLLGVLNTYVSNNNYVEYDAEDDWKKSSNDHLRHRQQVHREMANIVNRSMSRFSREQEQAFFALVKEAVPVIGVILLLLIFCVLLACGVIN